MGALVSWFRRYRPWVFSGLTVVSILLIVWARFGFTFQVSQFFASQCPEDADTGECVDGGGGGSAPPPQSRKEQGGCAVAAHATENCCLDPGNISCLQQDRAQHYNAGTNWGGCAIERLNTCEFGCEGAPNATCKAAPVSPPSEPSEPEPEPTTVAQAPPAQTPIQTPMETPAATPLTLECAPAEQAVGIEQEATYEAGGGSGDYEWFVAETDMDAPESGATFTFSYDSPGAYEVTVNDGTSVATCILSVIEEEEQISCTADVQQCEDGSFVGRIPPSCQFETCPSRVPATTGLLLSGEIRNFTESGDFNQTASGVPSQQFQVRMLVRSSSEVRNTHLNATLPDTVTYQTGTTTIDGQPSSVDTIAAGGLAVGSLDGVMEVTFRVIAKAAGQLPSGTLTSQISLAVQGDNATRLTDSVTFILDNAPIIAQVGEVPTGPGDVMLLALMAAALLTLLYVSYTYTHLYRSREVGTITKRRDPLNFK